MERLWTPWRYKYLTAAQKKDECIFCLAKNSENSLDCYLLYRSELNIIILNLFPYTNGHLIIAPTMHIPSPVNSTQEQLSEMSFLMTESLKFLKEIYNADGFNIGMNIGKCAGAGFDQHFHMHILPRWTGDTNFMATIAETRLIPEDLDDTYQKLLPKYQNLTYKSTKNNKK